MAAHATPVRASAPTHSDEVVPNASVTGSLPPARSSEPSRHDSRPKSDDPGPGEEPVCHAAAAAAVAPTDSSTACSTIADVSNRDNFAENAASSRKSALVGDSLNAHSAAQSPSGARAPPLLAEIAHEGQCTSVRQVVMVQTPQPQFSSAAVASTSTDSPHLQAVYSAVAERFEKYRKDRSDMNPRALLLEVVKQASRAAGTASAVASGSEVGAPSFPVAPPQPSSSSLSVPPSIQFVVGAAATAVVPHATGSRTSQTSPSQQPTAGYDATLESGDSRSMPLDNVSSVAEQSSPENPSRRFSNGENSHSQNAPRMSVLDGSSEAMLRVVPLFTNGPILVTSATQNGASSVHDGSAQRPRFVSAVDEPVIVDREVAALINFQNREESASSGGDHPSGGFSGYNVANHTHFEDPQNRDPVESEGRGAVDTRSTPEDEGTTSRTTDDCDDTRCVYNGNRSTGGIGAVAYPSYDDEMIDLRSNRSTNTIASTSMFAASSVASRSALSSSELFDCGGTERPELTAFGSRVKPNGPSSVFPLEKSLATKATGLPLPNALESCGRVEARVIAPQDDVGSTLCSDPGCTVVSAAPPQQLHSCTTAGPQQGTTMPQRMTLSWPRPDPTGYSGSQPGPRISLTEPPMSPERQLLHHAFCQTQLGSISSSNEASATGANGAPISVGMTQAQTRLQSNNNSVPCQPPLIQQPEQQQQQQTAHQTHLPAQLILPSRRCAHSSSVSGSATGSTEQIRFPEPQGAAWKTFTGALRQIGPADKISYLEKRPGGAMSTRKKNVVQQFLLQEAQGHGKYVQWSPTVELAFSSCTHPDVAEGSKAICSVLGLRSKFIRTFEDLDSMCIFPMEMPRIPGEGSSEPLFLPQRAPILGPIDAVFRMENGVVRVYWDPGVNSRATTSSAAPSTVGSTFKQGNPMEVKMYKDRPLWTSSGAVPSVESFIFALKCVMGVVQNPAAKAFAFQRLQYLENKFSTHLMFNSLAELEESKRNKHRDFYNVRKVDTHVHHSACAHQKHLLRFIRRKYRTEPNQIVAKSDTGMLTLKGLFDMEVGVSAWDASVDLLNVHALGSCFHRFDIFNSKYNPFGQALLREVFLKTDNLIKGRYLAELTKEVVSDLEEGKYQFVEWRVSIYGKSRDEWKKLACWIRDNGLWSKQVRWMIQVPRLFHVYRKLNLVQCFEDLLRNVFEPVFEAVINPEAHPEIYFMLLQLNGWDSVDDESVISKHTMEGGPLPYPAAWTDASNPPYSYWAYYMYANIRALNELLAARNLRILPFRPHCGEAGSISHLASMYLLADGINHGIMLRKSPVLQYIYYLHQIGLAMSPLSNNALFHDITKNPFYKFFSVGLNVSLSTDDPLMFHFTDEPLLEEYSCCAHVWKMTPVDLCEIAANSVRQSHFEPQLKRHWLGENFTESGHRGNSMQHSNVSNIRAQYREDTLRAELDYLLGFFRFPEILDEVLSSTSCGRKGSVIDG